MTPAEFDQVLAQLKARGLSKMQSMRAVHETLGLSLGEAKLAVHRSPVWNDRRAGDEAFEEELVRGLFALAVQGEAQINAPAEDVAECRDRQQRATTLMREVAAGMPADVLDRYRGLLADGLLGQAFEELALRDRGGRHRAQLAAVADALLLGGPA